MKKKTIKRINIFDVIIDAVLLLIIMQSEFKFQYQYSPNEPWKPFKHVLPENPSDAYKMYNTETVKNLKGI